MKTPKEEERKQRPKGDGSVYLRQSDGRWCGTVTLPPSLTGQRRRKTVTAKTEKEAKAKLAVLMRQKEKDGDIPTKTQTFQSWANVWFTTIALKKIRPKTAATYRTYLEQYIIPVIGDVQLLKLTPTHIRRVHEYIESKGLSATTVLQAHNIISVCLRYALQEGRVLKNVAAKDSMDRPVKASSDLVILTAQDAKKVLQSVESDRLASRWVAAFFTGARQGELLGLEIDRLGNYLDLSWQLQRLAWEHGCKDRCGRKRATDCPDRTITKPSGWEHRYLEGGLWLTRPKTEKSRRVIPVFPELASVIEKRLFEAASEPNQHGLLWTSDRKLSKGGTSVRKLLPLDGSPIDPSRDNKAWHEVLRRAGVPDARLHDARHTFASLLLQVNSPQTASMKIMGHSTHAVTQGYQDVEYEQLADILTRASSLLR